MKKKISRSKKLLKEAIINLLNKKDMDQITVKELVIEADINRSTFYVNYSSKEELIDEIIEDLMAEIRIQLYKPLLNEHKEEYYHNIYLKLIDLFEFIYHERRIITALLQSNIKYKLKELLYNEIIYTSQEKAVYQQSEGPPIDLDLYIHYSNSALVGAIFYWIDNGFQHTPEDFSKELTKMSRNPPFKYKYKR